MSENKSEHDPTTFEGPQRTDTYTSILAKLSEWQTPASIVALKDLVDTQMITQPQADDLREKINQGTENTVKSPQGLN